MQRLNLSCLLLSVHALLPAPITCPPAHPMLSPNMPAPQHSTQRTHLEDLDQLQLAAALQLKALRSAGRKEGVRKRAEGRHSKQVSKPWAMRQLRSLTLIPHSHPPTHPPSLLPPTHLELCQGSVVVEHRVALLDQLALLLGCRQDHGLQRRRVLQ